MFMVPPARNGTTRLTQRRQRLGLALSEFISQVTDPNEKVLHIVYNLPNLQLLHRIARPFVACIALDTPGDVCKSPT